MCNLNFEVVGNRIILRMRHQINSKLNQRQVSNKSFAFELYMAQGRTPYCRLVPGPHVGNSSQLKVKFSRYRPCVAQRVGRGI